MRIGWDIGLCLEKEVDEQWRREGCFLAEFCSAVGGKINV